MVRTRFAPSPTGFDAHIGLAYTALLNLAFARKNKGKFILRLEDTDRQRFVPEFWQNFKSSMAWLGIDWDEGPYVQSERLDLYKKYALALVEKDAAYFCFCSKERLENLRKSQTEKGQLTQYDGLCRKLEKDDSKERYEKGEAGVVRLKVPEDGQTVVNDVVRGEVCFDNKQIDDQVLLKSDGYPTYHLAVVVDDYLMRISHVIRAEEWLSSTPKHVLIYKALGWPLPVFAHTPILRNPDKSKLSKRKNPVWLSWYRQQGFLSEALINYLTLQAWSHPEGKEIFSLDEFIEKFTLEKISKTGPAFDLKKLEWFNGEYVRRDQRSKIKDQIYEFYNGKFTLGQIERVLPLVRERIKKLNEFESLVKFLFTDEIGYEEGLEIKADHLRLAAESLDRLNDWRAREIEAALRNLAEQQKIKPAEIFTSLRNAVSGQKVTPPLFECLEILGREKTLKRLEVNLVPPAGIGPALPD